MAEYKDYEEALENAVQVKELTLYYNDDSYPGTIQFPDHRIKKLENLEKLTIWGFFDAEIALPREVLELQKLTEFTIYGENLLKLPDLVWELENLTSLTLRLASTDSNNIKFDRLKKLKRIWYENQEIKELSEAFFGARNLTSLHIQSESLVYISDEIGSLSFLENLTLHCKILELPVSIENLKKLKQIDFSNKETKSFDVNLSDLTDLENVRWGNSSFFPVGLTTAPNLKQLMFDKTHYSDINVTELPFKNLSKLRFSHAQFKKVPKCFSSLISLQSLDLESCDFDEIEFNFDKLENLHFISFMYCDNFEKINMFRLVESLQSIPNLKSVETPELNTEQKAVLKSFDLKFEWTYENQYDDDYDE